MSDDFSVQKEQNCVFVDPEKAYDRMTKHKLALKALVQDRYEDSVAGGGEVGGGLHWGSPLNSFFNYNGDGQADR